MRAPRSLAALVFLGWAAGASTGAGVASLSEGPGLRSPDHVVAVADDAPAPAEDAPEALSKTKEVLVDAWDPLAAAVDAAEPGEGNEGTSTGPSSVPDDAELPVPDRHVIHQDDNWNSTKPPFPPQGTTSSVVPFRKMGDRAVYSAANPVAEKPKPPPPGGETGVGVEQVQCSVVGRWCSPGSPDFDRDGVVCANDGQPNEAYCNYSPGFGGNACVTGCRTRENLCSVDHPNWVGDGYCDKNGGYNTPECNFDGGDCCEGTCENDDYTCGYNEYDCKPAGWADQEKERFKIGFKCGALEGDPFSNIQFSYKRDDQWHGLTFWGDRYCKRNLATIIDGWQFKELDYTTHIQAFRIRQRDGQNQALNMDMVKLVKERRHCNGEIALCPDMIRTEHDIQEYGVSGGNSYCLNGVSSFPSDWSCAEGRTYTCFEFWLDGSVRSCE